MTDRLATDLVDTINARFGRHAGARAVHARGSFCDATFTPAAGATALTRAAPLQGPPVSALVRFSTGSGDPAAHDGVRDARGMAVKLRADEPLDFLAVTSPQFVSRTPEDFLELLRVSQPDPKTGQPDFAVLGPYLQAHPETAAALQAGLGHEPEASYLAARYNGTHAFRWVAADGSARWVRTLWEPAAGVQTLPDADAMAREHDYLQTDLRDRLAAGPATFTLFARLAQDSDPLDDPTQPWPQEREAVAVATLEITGVVADPEAGGEVVVFDPMRLADGIEPSDDPVLRMRPHAYGVSAERRAP